MEKYRGKYRAKLHITELNSDLFSALDQSKGSQANNKQLEHHKISTCMHQVGQQLTR